MTMSLERHRAFGNELKEMHSRIGALGLHYATDSKQARAALEASGAIFSLRAVMEETAFAEHPDKPILYHDNEEECTAPKFDASGFRGYLGYRAAPARSQRVVIHEVPLRSGFCRFRAVAGTAC